MPRTTRKQSKLNIYHAVLSSVNKQIIFEEDADCKYFLDSLKKSCLVSTCNVLAYCLMDNHIHLILEMAGNESIGTLIQRIASRFVIRYNQKYERKGHLFQGRFFGEPIETEQYLINAVRYVLQNPVRAGIVSAPGEYPWSSCRAYMGSNDQITNPDTFRALFSSDEEMADCLNTMISKEDFKSMNGAGRLTDREALKVLADTTGCSNPSDFQMIPKQKRNEYLRKLKNKGLSVRQISRLTGVSKTTVERAK